MGGKYLILVGDGMADRPDDFADGRTPLMRASTPNMDRMAAAAGLVRTVPEGMSPGSDVANMSLLGYDPGRYYTGRAPLEAASMGVDLSPSQMAYRCNLVHLEPGAGGVLSPDAVMGSYSSGHISTPEARSIVEDLDRELGSAACRFFAGVSYRHLLVLDGAPDGTVFTPPHDISGKAIGGHLPEGEGADLILELMHRAAPVLAAHSVNREREARGEVAANSIWLWGHGRKPSMPPFAEHYGLRGAVISAVDLLKGLGRVLGMTVVDVPGATGYLDTNYEGKVEAALRLLREVDLVFVHVEAPDEAGHQGDEKAKLKAIEDFDRRVVGPALAGLSSFDDWSALVVADHPTPLSVMTHTADPVPFAILRSGDAAGGEGRYDEVFASRGDLLPDGGALMLRLLAGEGHEEAR